VTVSVPSSTTVVANDDDVDTWQRYDVAPNEVFQPRVSAVPWPVAPFAGVESTGADGAEGAVAKLHVADQALVPPALVAFTRQ
jgi:hypothetical protein